MTPKPISNHVLVKVNIHNNKFILSNGHELILDTSFEVARHTSVNCEVVAVPDKLYYNREASFDKSMPHKCNMQLQTGDIVIVRFVEVMNALGDINPKWYKEGDEVFFFVKYNEIFVAKRKWTDTEKDVFNKSNPFYTIEELEKNNVIKEGEDFYSVIPLNGVVIVEPIPKDVLTKLILPESVKRKRKMTMSKTVFVGEPNMEYWDKIHPPDVDIANGDMIITYKDVDIPLEAEEHCTFNGKKQYWRIDRNNIVVAVKPLKEALQAIGMEGDIQVKE